MFNSMDDLQNINKLASALLLFIKVPNWIYHKKYIEKDRWNLNLRATMKRQVCLHFANRPFIFRTTLSPLSLHFKFNNNLKYIKIIHLSDKISNSATNL
jgi:hypothetical protein